VNTGSANVVGLGLIGGSIAGALTKRGIQVHGVDLDPSVVQRALSMEVITDSALDPHAHITFVTTPVTSIPVVVKEMLKQTHGVVTDVGSVKGSVCAAIDDPRFIGGHPMAGSELHGLDGSNSDLFEGATWVLTPTKSTSDLTFRTTAETIKAFGAEIMVLQPEQHDHLVAIVSHLPHLTAATLMGLASHESEENLAVLRLAAGGFRDMTRVASGSAPIWIDICRENRTAIIKALDQMVVGLGRMRDFVADGEYEALLATLQQAREARSNLPGRIGDLSSVVEVRIPISDRSGSAAEIFLIAADLGVNILNFEVSHSVEGLSGVLVLIIERHTQEQFVDGLLTRGFRPVVNTIT